jgi:hypothetical protein
VLISVKGGATGESSSEATRLVNTLPACLLALQLVMEVNVWLPISAYSPVFTSDGLEDGGGTPWLAFECTTSPKNSQAHAY